MALGVPLTAFLLVLVASSGSYFFSLPVADNDLWGHIFFGRRILAEGLPALNQYSYTAPAHPWINHEIFAECCFAAIYDRLGSPGLLAFKLLLGLATLAVLGGAARRRAREPLAWCSALVVAASMMSWGYLVRPQIFSFFALAVLWNALQRTAMGDRGRSIWILPPLFAVWVNSHGGVAAGAAVLLVFGLVHSLTEDGRSSRRQLALATIASLLALLLNPYGIGLPLFLLEDLHRVRQISEWAPIPITDLSNAHFKAVVALSILGLLLPRKRYPWEILVLGIAAVATFRHERHLPLFAILVTPHLAETFELLIARLRAKTGLGEISPGAAAALASGLLAISAVQLTWVTGLYRSLGFQIMVSPADFPVDAVRFMRRNHLRGNLEVPFNWGEYAIWHLYPDCPVSIDGRYTTAYPEDVIEQTIRLEEGSPGWDDILRGASLALVDRRQGTANRLFHHPDWRYIYSDQTALVFVRKDLPLPQSLVREPRLSPDGAFNFP